VTCTLVYLRSRIDPAGEQNSQFVTVHKSALIGPSRTFPDFRFSAGVG